MQRDISRLEMVKRFLFMEKKLSAASFPKQTQEASVHHTCGEGETGGDVHSLRIQCFNSSSSKPAPTTIYNFTARKRGVLWSIARHTRRLHSRRWLTDIVWVQSCRSVAQIRVRRTSSASINPAAGESPTHTDDGAESTKSREIFRTQWVRMGLIARTARLDWDRVAQVNE